MIRQVASLAFFAVVVPLLAIAGAELVLRNWWAMPAQTSDLIALRQARAEKQGLALDWRPRSEVVANCPDCKTFISPMEAGKVEGDLVPPVGGPPSSRLVTCNELGRWQIVPSDRYGFFNRDPSLYRSSDITLLGDSYAAASCVESADRVPAHLEDGGYRVLNLGMAGFQPIDELAALKEFGGTTRALVWMYYEGNDYAEAKNHGFLSRYLDSDFTQDLKAHPERIEAFFDHYKRPARPESPSGIGVRLSQLAMNTLPALSSLVKHVSTEPRRAARIRKGPLPALMRRILSNARGWGVKHGATEFVFVYLPAHARYAWRPAGHVERSFYDAQKAIMTEAAAETGFRFVDIERAMADSGDPLAYYPFRAHGHYTPEGYRLVAEEIARALEAAGLATGSTGSGDAALPAFIEVGTEAPAAKP